ncbi:AI-2E family transporter [bacterium]|nr:AI-2E family transporter [bacterium]MCI0606280.1 AI-2E family transporter [bacterium]
MTEPENSLLQGPHEERIRKLQSEKFSRYFLLVLFIGIIILFFNMIKIFLIPIVLAAVITTLFYPFYLSLLSGVRNRRNIAAFLCCFVLLIVFLIPLFFLAQIVSGEAAQFYQTAGQKLREWFSPGQDGLLMRLQQNPWFQRLRLDQWNWQQALGDVFSNAGSLLATIISKTSGGAFYLLANVFVTLFICFYFFRDGESMMKSIRKLVPLSDRYIDALIGRFTLVSRATIKGTVVIGLIQSTLGAITLWIFGVGSPLLWFMVMLILSFIPIVGAWLVMHPAAIIQFLLGHHWQGIGIFLVTILIISNIDNVIRPRLVGQFSGLHDLIIFFSALGGIKMFGPLGVLIGPVVASFFVTLLEIYSVEFKSHLEISTETPRIVGPPASQ